MTLFHSAPAALPTMFLGPRCATTAACACECRDDLAPGSFFLRGLCHFADPANAADARRLAAACALVLASKAPAGDGQGLVLCAGAMPGGEARAAAAQHAQRLAALSLAALAQHAQRDPAFREALVTPRRGPAAMGAVDGSAASVAGALLEGVLALAGAGPGGSPQRPARSSPPPPPPALSCSSVRRGS